MPGPIPSRSDQRVRRNLPDVPIEKITAIGPVQPPGLGIANAHRLVRGIYESMKNSAQSKYYEESDWAYALVTLHVLDEYLKQGKPSAMMLASIDSMLAKLLLTEGDRRRSRIEIERNKTEDAGGKVLVSDRFRQILTQPTQTGSPGGG